MNTTDANVGRTGIPQSMQITRDNTAELRFASAWLSTVTRAAKQLTSLIFVILVAACAARGGASSRAERSKLQPSPVVDDDGDRYAAQSGAALASENPQDDEATAVVILSRTPDSDTDIPEFKIMLYANGRFVARGTHCLGLRQGFVQPSAIRALLRDAETFGFCRFPDRLHAEREVAPDLKLTFLCQGVRKAVQFTPIYYEDLATRIRLENRETEVPWYVCHLLGRQILMLVPWD